jgi:hypothetical protein
MCTQFTTLAESNDFRHILQCEHGAIHLSWDLVTLYLNLGEFERLADLLEQGTRLAAPATLAEQPCLLIYKEEHTYYQLWIRNVAVNLTPVDFLILVDMVQVAFRTVTRRQVLGAAGAPDEPPAEVYRRTTAASANASFSLN